MRRGNFVAAAVALVCLSTVSCGRLQLSSSGPPPAPATIDPSSAIALSVLADSIYLIDPATGEIQTVARGLTDFQSGYATWSPDHRYLAWGDAGVTIRDVAKGTERQIDQGQSFSMPAWSPDGTRIAFSDSAQVWIARADGTRRAGLAVPSTLAPLAIAWAPGTALAFEGLQLDCVDAPSCVSTDRSEIWTIKPDGTGLRPLTRVGHAENPKWSPDGTEVLFIRRFPLSKTPRSELWAVSAKGTGAKRLVAATNVIAAAWSRTGQQIAMVRTGSLPNTLQVWVARADGTDAHPIGQIVGGTDATIDW